MQPMTPISLREATTRSRIDGQLRAAGWTVTRYASQPWPAYAAVEEYPTPTGPADYALCVNSQPLAVVEAKRTVRDAYSALAQARRYAEGLETPFLYTANGDEIWFQDVRPEGGVPRAVPAFHSPQALLEMQTRDPAALKDTLRAIPLDQVNLWHHQQEAVEAVEQALFDNKRRMLIAMATGTGKTRAIVALLHRLLASGYIRRALFLIDRLELAEQAEDAMSQYDVQVGLKFNQVYTVGRVEGRSIPRAQVCVATLQTMYNVVNDPDAAPPMEMFDVVISDECHRSIYGDWRVVLDHFDAVQIGLTATPATHTVAYFGHLVYTYSYSQALEDRKLVPYETAVVYTGITMQGLDYGGEHYNPSQLERGITVPHRNRLIAEEYRNHTPRDRKAIVYAINDYHATQLAKAFEEVYSDKPAGYVQKITYQVDQPHEKIKALRRPGRPPFIAVTVDMITTGVDVKCMEGLVFVRPTRSRILFEQMCGRGTRIYIFPDGRVKQRFTIFDCVGIIEHFRGVSDFGTYRPRPERRAVAEPRPPYKTRMIVADDVLDEVLVSEMEFVTRDGRKLRAEDYIEAFEAWVRAHAEEIAALRVLMHAPLELTAADVAAIETALAEAPETFTEERLQRAYRQPLVDMLAFVKSVLTGKPLRTVEERVTQAIDTWLWDKVFTPQQREWIEAIRRHFIQERQIEREDFDYVPFLPMGGWARAVRVFGQPNLEQTLRELNTVVLH
jgi:type I restriction enzyme R subunit